MLSDCEMMEAECIFLLIDNGIISNKICLEFMESTYHTNYEMFVLLDWMLMRWVCLRKHKFHLPKRRRNPNWANVLNLINLINRNST